MRISLIVAMAENYVIGVNNQLPWHLPADLKHFRSVTIGHPIVMGRKTFDSIGRPLPGRQNIVVTRNADYAKVGIDIVHSLEAAFQRCKANDEVFVIGGAEIYREAMQHADRIYLTRVHTVVEGEASFPMLDAKEWKEIERVSQPADVENTFACEFIIYDRKN